MQSHMHAAPFFMPASCLSRTSCSCKNARPLPVPVTFTLSRTRQVFNQYLLQPSHGSFANSGVSLRIMDYMQWVNSKIFFK